MIMKKEKIWNLGVFLALLVYFYGLINSIIQLTNHDITFNLMGVIFCLLFFKINRILELEEVRNIERYNMP